MSICTVECIQLISAVQQTIEKNQYRDSMFVNCLLFVFHYHYHCIAFAISIAIAVDIAIALILPLSLLNRVYIHVVITGAKMHNGVDSHYCMKYEYYVPEAAKANADRYITQKLSEGPLLNHGCCKRGRTSEGKDT